MEPIVSPWVVYLIMHADSISDNPWSLLVFFFGLAYFGILLISTKNDEEIKKVLGGWKMKLWLFVFAIAAFANMMFPNTKTITAMYVAQHITPTTITKAVDAGKDIRRVVKKDILDIINAINKEETNEKTK